MALELDDLEQREEQAIAAARAGSKKQETPSLSIVGKISSLAKKILSPITNAIGVTDLIWKRPDAPKTIEPRSHRELGSFNEQEADDLHYQPKRTDHAARIEKERSGEAPSAEVAPARRA